MSAPSNGCLPGQSFLTFAQKATSCSLSGLSQIQAMNAYLASEIKVAKCLCPTVFNDEDSMFGCTFNNDGVAVTMNSILARIECGQSLLSEQEVWNTLVRLSFLRQECCAASPIYA